MDFSDTQPAIATLERTFAPPGKSSLLRKLSPVQFFPPRAIEWNRFELELHRWPVALNGFRIVHLSDFHLRRHWPPAFDLMLDCINENPPDLILLAGDFVDNKRNYRPAMPQVRRLVAGLKARFGCFAIHGNHDSYKIGKELGDTPLTFLDGRRHLLETPAGPLELIGLPGKNRRELTRDFLNSLPTPEPGTPRIVLSHFPDHLKRIGNLNPDLFLAGHTHGGQICLPGGQPIIWHDALPRKLCRGVHRVGKTWLVVSRGFGYTGIPLRTYSCPEVIEICVGSHRE